MNKINVNGTKYDCVTAFNVLGKNYIAFTNYTPSPIGSEIILNIGENRDGGLFTINDEEWNNTVKPEIINIAKGISNCIVDNKIENFTMTENIKELSLKEDKLKLIIEKSSINENFNNEQPITMEQPVSNDFVSIPNNEMTNEMDTPINAIPEPTPLTVDNTVEMGPIDMTSSNPGLTEQQMDNNFISPFANSFDTNLNPVSNITEPVMENSVQVNPIMENPVQPVDNNIVSPFISNVQPTMENNEDSLDSILYDLEALTERIRNLKSKEDYSYQKVA